jgi:hypothetical protein
MILPYRDKDGKRNGFLASGAVYTINGRKLGNLLGHQVFDSKGVVVAEVEDDQLSLIKPLPWTTRTVDSIRSTLRHLGLMPVRELSD